MAKNNSVNVDINKLLEDNNRIVVQSGTTIAYIEEEIKKIKNRMNEIDHNLSLLL